MNKLLVFLCSSLLYFTASAKLQAIEPGSVATGSMKMGDAVVEITLEKIAGGKAYFTYSINTHTVDLSQIDFKKDARLIYDGKEISPLEAKEPSGHHAKGSLVFSIPQDAKAIKIILKNVGKTNERVFEWQ